MSFLQELELARRVALEAAALVRQYQGQTVHVDQKAGNEPVTEADRAANELIVERLSTAFPDDAILSEELPDDRSRFERDRVWMVDPIDGTRDFIQGDSGFAVMIGLCVAGRPQVGVVAQPTTGIVWGASVGETAWKELRDGARTPLATSSLAQPPGIRLVASKSHRTADIDQFRQALAIEEEINVGGVGLKMSMVADGSRDLYVYPGGRTKKWDSCAPEAILTAAGGRVTTIDGDRLSYTEEDLLNRRGLVASNGPLHDRVLEVLRTLTSKRPLPM